MKANEGDRIRLVKKVCYGSAYGLIEIEEGKEFTVKERNNSDDGIHTVEVIQLMGSSLGNKDCHIHVWDNEYEIIKL